MSKNLEIYCFEDSQNRFNLNQVELNDLNRTLALSLSPRQRWPENQQKSLPPRRPQSSDNSDTDDNNGKSSWLKADWESSNDVSGVAHLRRSCDRLDWSEFIVSVVLGDSYEHKGDDYSYHRAKEEV